MRRSYFRTTLLLVSLMFLLAGCRGVGDLPVRPVLPSVAPITPEEIIPAQETDRPYEEITYSGDGTVAAEPGETDPSKFRYAPEEAVSALRASSAGEYYYEKLDDTERHLYGEILYILADQREDISLTLPDKDRIDRVFKFVINDHPEIFYVDGYTYTLYLLGDTPSHLLFTGSYTMTKEAAEHYLTGIEDYYNTFRSALVTSGINLEDDYEVIRFTYEYVIDHTEYDKSAPNNQSIVSVMTQHRSVCSGYSKTMQYLLNRCGIYTTVVLGSVRGGEPHSWNLVLCNGCYYYVDATWGDASYRQDNTEGSSYLPPINYNFLLVTESDLTPTHIFDDRQLMPDCTARADNYYIREGTYFTSADPEQLRLTFQRAYERGDAYVTIKMADADVYAGVWEHLLGEQHVFEYLSSGSNSVSYSENPEGLYMVFYL